MNPSQAAAVQQFVADVGADRTRLLDVALAVQKRFGYMLFVEGIHPCPYCVASGDCELQALGYRRGMVAPTETYQWQKRKIDATHPDITLDHDRCILCSRCIRASRMEDGKTIFAFFGRGNEIASLK